MIANPARGEAALELSGQVLRLRPSFGALAVAEAEVGPLFAFVEQAASGKAGLEQIIALLWHCIADRPAELRREAFAEAVIAIGLVKLTPILASLLKQILAGR